MSAFYIFSAMAIFMPILPQAFSQVQVFPPMQTISTLNGSFQLVCTMPSSANGIKIISVDWLANETAILRNSTNPLQSFTGGLGSLCFTNLSQEYNNTQFRCNATLTSGVHALSTLSATLVLQGYLARVGSLNLVANNFTILLTWNAPFTLDITGTHPDIEGYLVYRKKRSASVPSSEEVNNPCSTFSSVSLESRNFTTNTTFEHTIADSGACYFYEYAVLPQNIVGDGAERKKCYDRTANLHPEVEKIVRLPDFNTFLFIMSAEVCYGGQLEFEDVDTGNVTNNFTMDGDFLKSVGGNNITFNTAGLTAHRYYNVNITTGIGNNSATSSITISTHGIESAHVVPSSDNVSVTVRYHNNSIVRGALVNLVSIDANKEVNFTGSFFLLLDRNTARVHEKLSPGHYKINVYDIGHDGTLPDGVGYPAVTRDISISNGAYYELTNGNTNSDCHIKSSLGFINVSCNFANESTRFQVIAQLSNASEVHKLNINRSVDHHTPVTIQAREKGTYRITIFSIKKGKGIVGSDVEYMDLVSVNGDNSNDGGGSDGGLDLGVLAALLGLPPTVHVIIMIIVIIVIMVPVGKKCINTTNM